MSNFRMLLMGGIACLTLVILTAVYLAGLSAGKSKVQRQWDQDRMTQLSNLAAQEAAQRAKEREWGEATTLLWASLRDAQEALRNDYEITIADMQSGALRLRDDIRGCRAQLPDDTITTTGDNAAGESGLSAARQGVALRIGADCDAVVLKLTAAQEYIRAIQP